MAVDGVALLGVGVPHIKLHVGYAACSVAPQFSCTPCLMQSASGTPSNAEETLVTLSTFHAAMFALNADAYANACEPNHTRSTPMESSSSQIHVGCTHAGIHTHTNTYIDTARCRIERAAETVHTPAIFDTAAVFHAPMFALNADAV